MHNDNNYHADNNDDDYLDEFELEGLVMTSNACSHSQSVFSSVGSGSGAGGRSRIRTRAQNTYTHLLRHCSPVMALCSLAWNPHNRSTSAIVLLFIAFLCMAILTKNDVMAWHRSIFSHTSHKKSTKLDPFSNLTTEQRQSLLKTIYGTYTFYDGSAEDRPSTPYMTEANAGNAYLDLPSEKFPLESWQADAVYANHFLDASEKLVKRAMQAIFATYHGHGLSDVHVVVSQQQQQADVSEDGGEEGKVEYTMEDADERSSRRSKMFHLEEIDLHKVTSIEELEAVAPSWDKKGGWTTERSFDGLKRRLIHAMMTNSNFTVVITGSWQSMGYGGNHAWQSIAGVFETLLKGLFEKLGVNLVVRAIGLPPLAGLSLEEEMELAKGGRSTLIHALGFSSIYGSDVDMIVWDDYSSKEDGTSSHALDEFGAQLFDFFARQALLSGTTHLPFIWGGDFTVLRNLHEHADADIGQLGNALLGVPETSSRKVAYDLPWAAQYLNCPKDMQSTCEDEVHLFESRCWVEQPEFVPLTPQLDHIPILPSAIGWRMHQLKGYTLVYILLQATLDSLFEWSDITISQGFPLADEYWHMGKYIENVQDKIRSLDESSAPHCFQLEEKINLPKRLCTHKMKGRTEFTPRADPSETNVRSIIDSSQEISKMTQLLLDGNEVENPIRTIPKGEVDALEIFDLRGKRRLLPGLLMERNVTRVNGVEVDYIDGHLNAQYRRRSVAIIPGAGWQVLNGLGDDCDGSLSSTISCGRLPSSTCLLEDHQGSRGGIWGNETTEWLVLHGIDTENGYVALNLEVGDRNKTRQDLLNSLPDSFVIEYAVDGTITSLDKSFFEKSKQPVPGMTLVNVFNDETIKEAKDVIVAVRLKGCVDSTSCRIAVTHVYWS